MLVILQEKLKILYRNKGSTCFFIKCHQKNKELVAFNGLARVADVITSLGRQE